MFGLGYQELLLILVIVLILFGAQRLPDLAKSLGSSVKEFKKGVSEITKDDTEVKFELKATADAQVGQHKQLIAQFTLEKDGETMTNSVARGGILRVDKASVAKK